MTDDRRSPRPPRLSARLLRLLMPPAAHEVVAGDLDETFARDAAREGARVARRRYRRMVWRSIAAARRSGGWRDDDAPAAGRERRVLFAGLGSDARLGFRQMRRHPAHSLAVVATLALGVAATAVVFGLTHALMLTPLAYQQPERVVFLLGWDTRADSMRFNMSYADAMDLGDGVAALTDVATYRGRSATVGDDGFPERAQAYDVSANTFDLLGVAAAAGRTFRAEDRRGGGAPPVVLSYGFWQQRYGGDPAAIGRLIRIDRESHVVVGVMPRGFEFPVINFKGDLWTLLRDAPEWRTGPRNESPGLVAIGRVAPAASVAETQASASAVMARLAAAHPATNADRGVRVIPMAALGTDEATPVFAVLSIAALLVLLAAALNAAGLQLARGLAQTREVAVTAALGARRWRIVRQRLVESLWLAMTGGAAGAGLAWLALDAMRIAMPDFVRRVLPNADLVRLDLTTVAFSFAVAAATTVLSGLLPAWRTSRPQLTAPLKADAAGTIDGRTWLRSSLVAVQIAVSVALLVFTALLARSARNLSAVDPGFDVERVLAFSVSLPDGAYDTDASRQAFASALAERLSSLPGVEAAGFVNTLPFSTSDASIGFRVDGIDTGSGERSRAGLRVVTPGYLTAMGIPIRRGRTFTTADDRDTASVAIVNETFARRHFGGVEAVGRVLRLSDRRPDEAVTVIGVVGDVQHSTLAGGATPEIYVPFGRLPLDTLTAAVRASGDPAALASLMRPVVAAVDPDLAIYDLATVTDIVGNSVFAARAATAVIVVFGAAAMALTAVGLYGLMAVSIGRRTREIGVRVALGATRGDVLRLVTRHTIGVTAAGLVLGVALGALGGQAIGALLFGVTAGDPVSFIAAIALVSIVAAAATWLPARRALAIDPARAIQPG